MNNGLLLGLFLILTLMVLDSASGTPARGELLPEPNAIIGRVVPPTGNRAGDVPVDQISATGCNLTQYFVVSQPNGTFYGNQGRNRTIDPTVCDDPQLYQSMFVNSIYVTKDEYNGVELGWLEDPDDGRVFFGVRLLYNDLLIHIYGPVSANTDHTYRLVSELVPGGDKQWKYYVDGSLKLTFRT